MKGRMESLSVGADGKQHLTLALSGDARTYYDELKDSDVNIEIRKWHRKRTKDANAYAWTLIDKIADKMRMGKSDVYRELILNVPGISERVAVANTEAARRLCEYWEARGLGWQAIVEESRVDDWIYIELYCGSSTFDSRQMSILIDLAVHECQLLGIETLTPAQLELLKDEWATRKERTA